MTDTPLQKMKNLEQENHELRKKLRDYEKLIETGLTRSEKKYQSVLDSSADSICIIQDGIVKYINKSLLKASGLSEKELLGKPFDQFIMPEERPTVMEHYKKRMAGLKVPNSYESKAKIGGGKIADIEINVSLTTYQGKKAEQITVRDITEKKKTEENLRIYEKILSVTNDLMAYIDSGYNYQAVNDAYLTFHNIKREEIIGTRVSEILGEQVYKEVVKEKLDRCFKGEVINYQHWFNYKNRGKKYMNVTYYPVYGIDHAIMGIVSSINDITRIKKIEEEIRENQVRYKNLFDNAPIPIWEEDFSEVKKIILKLQKKNIQNVRKYFEDHPEIISELVKKTRVIDINNETLNLYKAKSKEDLLGNLDKTFLPESLSIFTDVIIALMEGKNNFEDETRVKTLDGKILDVIFKMFTLETHVPDKPQHIAYVSTIDISERKKAEEALKVSEERFRSFVEQSSEGIYLFELEKPIHVGMPVEKQVQEFYAGRIVECNNAMAKMYGYSRAEDLIGLTLKDLHGSDDHPDNIEFILLWVKNNYQITHAISSEMDKNGNPVWFSNNMIGIVENGLLIRIWGTQTDITRQKQAQEALGISEEKFSRIFKSSPDAITLTSVREGTIIEANNSMFQLTGYNAEELIGKNTAQLGLWVDGKDRDRYVELLKKYGKVRNFEADFKIKNGDIRTGLISGELINLHDGTYILGIIRDITDRKNAQKALKQSEEFNRKIVGSSISGIYIVDLSEKKGVFLNPTATKLTGYTLEELQKRTGNEFLEYFHPDDRNILLEHVKKVSRSKDGEIFQYEYRYKHKKGNWIWLESRDTVFARDKKGNVIQLIGSFQDITDRVKAKEALQESEKRYKILAENTNDVIWTMNASRHFTYVSPAIEKLRGFTAEEVYKQNLENVLTPGSLEIVNEALRDFFSKLDKGTVDQSPSIFELEQIRKDGSTVWTEVVSNNISDGNGNFLFFLGVSRDISERKEAEMRIRKLNAELEQRVKERTAQLKASNNDLEAFAYSVSHDLRAPLRHIDGFSRLLYNQLKNVPPDTERYFTKITDSSGKMHRMIDDLLTFSRLGKRDINKTLVNLDFLIKEIVDDYKPEIKNQDIQWKISALGIVEGDRNLLRMVFDNLISNAIKFTANRRKSAIEISKKLISHDFIEIMVKDNGVGFDMKYAHKLFNVFQQLHNSDDFEGTGIGLANVKRIVQRHGGNVKAEGKENQGAVFYISLPNKN